MYIYGVDVETLKDKTTIRKLIPINNIVETPIPPKILDLHPKINLSAD